MLDRWRTWIIGWSRYTKRTILVAIDLLVLSVALYVPLTIRYGYLYSPPDWGGMALLVAAPLITVFFLWHGGIYRRVTRFFGFGAVGRIWGSVAVSVLVWALIVFMSGQLGVPRSVILTYGLLAALLLTGLRYMAGTLLERNYLPQRGGLEAPPKPTIIFGAGRMGLSLLEAAQKAGDRDVVAFVDPSPTLWRQYVGNVRVYSPEQLGVLIPRHEVREVLVALPGDQNDDRRRILSELERHAVEIKVLPGYEDVSSGRVRLSDLRPLDVVDLLGRAPIAPDRDLIAKTIVGKSILVTGAGGSIGSELVRQILSQRPRELVLLDASEVALYLIGTEVQERIEAGAFGPHAPAIRLVLGSVTNDTLVRSVIRQNRVDTIFHAAAYKHVPLVEENPVVGLENNVLGTYVVARAAVEEGVDRMVLVSTDKAVRPTNVMGASKRLSELIVQAYAASQAKTVFTMVRFGNVLDSSGSVVQRFRKQIQAGGPVTVTHREATRYFMSIPEAAGLVIQAGAMASGGEVFVLDMGEPVKIDFLARRMIQLSGVEVRNIDNPAGIEIVYMGLRPGEKLYEELLIGASTTTTEHPRIRRSEEPYLDVEALEREISALRAAIAARDLSAIQAILLRTVEGYSPSTLVATGVRAPEVAEARGS